MKQTLTTAVAASALFATTAAAGTLDDLNGTLNSLAADWNTGSANAVAVDYYTEDAMIAGEQMPTPARGTAEIEPLVAYLISEFPKAELAVDSIIAESDEQVSTWVLWTLPGNDASAPPATVRSLFVWVRTDEGWKVKADMYSFGAY